MSISTLGIVRGVRAAGTASADAGTGADTSGRATALGPTAAQIAALQAEYSDTVGYAAFLAAVGAAQAGVILTQTNGNQNIDVGGTYTRTYTCGRNTGTVRWAWYRVRGWVGGGATRRWDWIEYRTPTQAALADRISSTTCFGFLDGLGEEQARASAWERESSRKAAAYVSLVGELQALYRARLREVSQAQGAALRGAAEARADTYAATQQAAADRARAEARREARLDTGRAFSQTVLQSGGRTAAKLRERLESFRPDFRARWGEAATAALAAGADEAEAAVEATQTVAAEAAAAGLLDAIFPLEQPEYYPATWTALTTPWQALFLASAYPDDPAATALPIAPPDFYPSDVLALPIPWQNLFFQLAYTTETA